MSDCKYSKKLKSVFVTSNIKCRSNSAFFHLP